MTAETETTIPDVAPGHHILKVEFVANDHAPFFPNVVGRDLVRGEGVSARPGRAARATVRSRPWPSAASWRAGTALLLAADPLRDAARRARVTLLALLYGVLLVGLAAVPVPADRAAREPGRGARRPASAAVVAGRLGVRTPGRGAVRGLGPAALAPGRRRRGGALPPGGLRRSSSPAGRSAVVRLTALLFAAIHLPALRRRRRSPSTSAPGCCSAGSAGPRARGPSPRHPCRGQPAWR